MKKLTKILLVFVAAVMSASTVSAQSSGLKVVTGNPDFKVKIKRCEASGKTVVIDMVLENINPKDANISFNPGYHIFAYDDEGNKYGGNGSGKILFTVAGENTLYSNINLPSDVPLKARLQLEGIPESVQMFKRLDITWVCRLYGGTDWLGDNAKAIKISNLPIYREGD